MNLRAKLGVAHRITPVETTGSRGERGATLVEFAFVAPLLFAIIFGIMDFGMVYADRIAQQQGAREGVRQAVTGNVGTSTCTISGSPPNSTVRDLVCLVKERSDISDARIRVALVFEPTAASSSAPETYTATRSLKICTMVQLQSVSGFYAPLLDSRVTRSQVQMRKEQLTTLASPPRAELVEFSETPLSGQSWNCARVRT
jgi:hypothetical protein